MTYSEHKLEFTFAKNLDDENLKRELVLDRIIEQQVLNLVRNLELLRSSKDPGYGQHA